MSREREEIIKDQGVANDAPPQYGVGPFTIREVALAGVWLIAFVVSFFPVVGPIGLGPSVWSSGIDWVLTIGVPTVAVFLLVLRRLSPQGIRRVGSLGIDQFASVAFSVAAVIWLTTIWTSFITLADQRVFAATWVVWVEFILMLIGVALTVFAPIIPPFDQDFRGRPEVPAHRNARPVRPVSPRPAPSRPSAAPAHGAGSAAPEGPSAPQAPVPQPTGPSAVAAETAHLDTHEATEPRRGDQQTEQPVDATADEAPTAVWEPTHTRESYEPVDTATTKVEPNAEQAPEAAHEPAAAVPPRHQAFWALVPEERDVVDEIGIPVFRIGPTAWALVIEDRGDVFVVRHEDGRIGYLHDVSGVTRG